MRSPKSDRAWAHNSLRGRVMRSTKSAMLDLRAVVVSDSCTPDARLLAMRIKDQIIALHDLLKKRVDP